MNFEGVNKILVIKLRHIGDVLLTVPVFRALRDSFPSASITALVNSGTEDVLRGNPLVNEIITLNREIKRQFPLKRCMKEIDFMKQVRERGFDMTVDLTGGDRAAILSYMSKARFRLGWKSNKGFIGKRHLYTHVHRPDGARHIVLQNLEVVGQFGIKTGDLSVNIHIPEDDRIFIKETLKENNITEEATIVHIHPTSRWLFKCWRDEFMAEVIGWLLDRGIAVMVSSSPDRREIKKVRDILSLVNENPMMIDLSGKTTIRRLAAISEASDLFFGVDSAPMHIAAAVGRPVVALFGPTGAFNWGPWENSLYSKEAPYPDRGGVQRFGMHTVIQRDWDCIPCGRDGCEGSKISRCLEEIKPAEVKEILIEKLKGAK